MQTALRVKTYVQPGHKIEFSAPELIEGEEVTVTVTSAAMVTSSATLAPSDPEARTALAQHLLASGAIPAIPAGRSGPPPLLITVRGQPVSETIIEERG